MTIQSHEKYRDVLDDISMWARAIDRAARAACLALEKDAPAAAERKMHLVDKCSEELRNSIYELDCIIQRGSDGYLPR